MKSIISVSLFTVASLIWMGAAIRPAMAQQVTITEAPPAVVPQKVVTAADRNAARRYIARGDDLYAHGSDWDVAATQYRMALQRDPTSAEAHYDLAGVLHDGGDSAEAILEYQQAIHLDMPDPAGPAQHPGQTADAYRQLGIIRQAQNQLISAVANFRISLRLMPSDAETHEHLGQALSDRGFSAEALTEYQSALRLDPQGQILDLPGLHVEMGNCRDALKQYVPAVQEYRTAVRLRPNDDVPHYDLAAELGLLNRYPEAIRECREAIRLNPDDALNHDELGVLLYDNGQHEEGRVEWRKVLRMGNPDEADAAREELAEYGGP